MLRLKKSFQYAALIALGSSALIGCGGESSSSNASNDKSTIVDTPNCFWVGPYSKNNPETNFAYPDDGARYWHAGYDIPTGASLKLNGQFPHARYMGLNSYYGGEKSAINYAAPVHSIADAAMEPNTGAINPFIDGANRTSEFRDYQVTLAAGNTPENVPANTLYGNAQGDDNTVILYRVYVPDAGKDIQGGVSLPEPELTLANGEILTGTAACDALKVDTEILETPFIPDATYNFLRGKGNPARNNLNEDGKTVRWKAAYNATYANQCSFLNQCQSDPVRLVNWYANEDNQYLSAFIDREIKSIVVIRGKIPNVPTTLTAKLPSIILNLSYAIGLFARTNTSLKK